jgi:hypothetical protein
MANYLNNNPKVPSLIEEAMLGRIYDEPKDDDKNFIEKRYDYYKNGNVKSHRQIGEYSYQGEIEGSENSVYSVMIDVEHPKRSTCNCLHAEGTRRVCKHKVALYLSIFPEEGDRVLREVEEWEAGEEQRWHDECKEIERYVNSLTKQELREQLLWRLIDERERNRRY